jgi:hypothetical protein
VFLGTLGAGQVMNLYSQPHDPQMQVNVMAWLTVAWALLLAAMRSGGGPVFGVLAVLSLAPLLLNVAFFSRWRGGDAEATAALATIEQRFPPDSTVFVYWGFEPITMWQYALWSRTWDWDGAPATRSSNGSRSTPAPSATPAGRRSSMPSRSAATSTPPSRAAIAS